MLEGARSERSDSPRPRWPADSFMVRGSRIGTSRCHRLEAVIDGSWVRLKACAEEPPELVRGSAPAELAVSTRSVGCQEDAYGRIGQLLGTELTCRLICR